MPTTRYLIAGMTGAFGAVVVAGVAMTAVTNDNTSASVTGDISNEVVDGTALPFSGSDVTVEVGHDYPPIELPGDGWMRAGDTPGYIYMPEATGDSDTEVHDRRGGGVVVGYIVPMLGYFDIETYTSTDFDRDSLAIERFGMTVAEAEAHLQAEVEASLELLDSENAE